MPILSFALSFFVLRTWLVLSRFLSGELFPWEGTQMNQRHAPEGEDDAFRLEPCRDGKQLSRKQRIREKRRADPENREYWTAKQLKRDERKRQGAEE
jgi:hypothetical protein